MAGSGCLGVQTRAVPTRVGTIVNVQSTVRWLVMAIAVGWLAAGGWYVLVRYDAQEEFRAQLREDRFTQQLKDCQGEFRQRYECKDAAIRAHGWDVFSFWANKALPKDE